jgi:signal transduction histidine kinase
MLEVARRASRSTPYHLEPGDLNRPVQAACGRFRRIVKDEGLDLEVRLSGEPLPLLMDPAAMDDVVTNLLSNAWKYRRGERARVAVRTARRGRRAELVVSDDGVGIPRGERRRVFEMFYRSNPLLTQSVAGTGLGLSLVRGIVRAHRGRIRIETGDGGVGTRFCLRFPLGHPAGVPAERADAETPDPAQNGAGGAWPAAAARASAPPRRLAPPPGPGTHA